MHGFALHASYSIIYMARYSVVGGGSCKRQLLRRRASASVFPQLNSEVMKPEVWGYVMLCICTCPVNSRFNVGAWARCFSGGRCHSASGHGHQYNLSYA